MNKYLILSLLISLSAFAQDDETVDAIKSPEVEMASETVAVPDIIDPISEGPIESDATGDSFLDNAAVTAPVEESVPDAPADATAETPDFEESATPDTNIPATVDKTEEPEVAAKLPPSSTPVLSTEMEEEKDFTYYKGHWASIFAFETIRYEAPFEFTNKRGKEVFSKKDQEFYGARLGFGREFYLFGGLNTTSRVEGYYDGSVTAKRKSANPDVKDVDRSYSKLTGQVAGIDFSQSLGYIFESKTRNPFMDEISSFTIEPFVEAGFGYARAVQKASYHEDTGTGVNGIREDYRLKVSDDIANARLGAGFNVGSRTGFYMFARVTYNRFEILKRSQDGSRRTDPTGASYQGPRQDLKDDDVKNAKLDPITMYTIGGGYRF